MNLPLHLLTEWIALWRDLPRYPRQVLLNRSHSRGSTIAICAAMLADLAFSHPAATVTVYVALIALGPSSLVAVFGAVAHALWDCGRIWTDLDCEWCGDDPDDGGPGDPEPDLPGGGGDQLVREITEHLQSLTTTTI